MKCQLSGQSYQRVPVLAFFLCKFNVLSGDILMASPLCWHSAVSKTVITVITSQGGCYLHCANEEVEIQGYLVQSLEAGNRWSQIFVVFLYLPMSDLIAHCMHSVYFLKIWEVLILVWLQILYLTFLLEIL